MSVCQWHTSCEPTEPAGETDAPKVFPEALSKSPSNQGGEKVRAALTEKTPGQTVRRREKIRQWHDIAPQEHPNSKNPPVWKAVLSILAERSGLTFRSLGPWT